MISPRRFALSLALVAILPLAACSKGPSIQAENATVGEVNGKVAEAGGAASFVNPGKWVSNVTIEEMSMPGMPPSAAAQMKGMMGTAHATTSCLTPEEAKRPKEDFFAGESGCRYDHFTMAGGKIDAVMKCDRPNGAQVMQIAGTYSPDTYNMVMASTSSEGRSAGMKMRMRVDAKRVGACDGTEGKL
jgi:hypothetical protein